MEYLKITTEKKEIERLLENIIHVITLAHWEPHKIDDLISVRYLLRRTHLTKYCKLIRSSPLGEPACQKSTDELIKNVQNSGKICFHHCHSGLIDFAFPFVINNKVIPIIGGQILLEPYTAQEIEKIAGDVSKRISLDPGLLKKALKRVPVVPLRVLKSLIALIVTIFEKLSINEVLQIISSIPGIISKKKYEKLYKAINFLKENYRENLSIDEIANKINVSPSYLAHIFKKYTGLSLCSYRENLRIEGAKELLISSEMPVTEIAFSLGWNDSNYFSLVFKRKTGLCPLAFRKTHKKSEIS